MIPIKIVSRNCGFTLIEAVIAMAILVIAILSFYTMQVNSIRGNSKSIKISTAASWNADRIERLLGLNYTHLDLEDKDGDGTGHDLNEDGQDDTVGSNFGLDDSTVATPDIALPSDDGNYTVYWNVAVDVPMKNLKTIRVIVFDNTQALSVPVTFTYIKADVI